MNMENEGLLFHKNAETGEWIPIGECKCLDDITEDIQSVPPIRDLNEWTFELKKSDQFEFTMQPDQNLCKVWEELPHAVTSSGDILTDTFNQMAKTLKKYADMVESTMDPMTAYLLSVFGVTKASRKNRMDIQRRESASRRRKRRAEKKRLALENYLRKNGKSVNTYRFHLKMGSSKEQLEEELMNKQSDYLGGLSKAAIMDFVQYMRRKFIDLPDDGIFYATLYGESVCSASATIAKFKKSDIDRFDEKCFIDVWGWPGPDMTIYRFEDYGLTWAFKLEDFVDGLGKNAKGLNIDNPICDKCLHNSIKLPDDGASYYHWPEECVAGCDGVAGVPKEPHRKEDAFEGIINGKSTS